MSSYSISHWVLHPTELKGQSVDGEVVSTNPLDLLTGDGLPRGLPTTPTNHSQRDSTVAPQPARYPTPETSEYFSTTVVSIEIE